MPRARRVAGEPSPAVRRGAALERLWAGRFTQERVGAALGTDQGYVSKLARGVIDPARMSLERAAALAELLGLPLEEFQRRILLAAPDEMSNRRSLPEDSAPSLHEVRRATDSPIVPLTPGARFLEAVEVPVRSIAAAGKPEVTGEDIVGTIVVPSEVVREGVHFVRAEGHSMSTSDPDSIQDGDTLFVDVRDRDVREGEVYCVNVPGAGVCVKRARRIAGGWVLASDNPRYPIVAAEEALVVGRVTEWLRHIRARRQGRERA